MSADAAVAILHARHGDSVLLIRRAERDDDPWSGHWSFPGGRRDAVDGDMLDTAVRELWEECGIALSRDNLETAMEPTLARRRAGPYVTVAPFVFALAEPVETTLDPREAAGCLWVPLKTLRDPRHHVLRPAPRLPAESLFPCIELPGAPLWGFTYRLITEWLGLLPESRDEAGLAAARDLLDALIADGFELVEPWSERFEGWRACVRGTITTAALLDRLAACEHGVPRMNVVDIARDSIRISGLRFEESVIEVVGGGIIES